MKIIIKSETWEGIQDLFEEIRENFENKTFDEDDTEKEYTADDLVVEKSDDWDKVFQEYKDTVAQHKTFSDIELRKECIYKAMDKFHLLSDAIVGANKMFNFIKDK